MTTSFDCFYSGIIERRRNLRIGGFSTLAEAEFDGHWITPYQKISCAENSPILLARSWYDVESAEKERKSLLRLGYNPNLPFNKIIDTALTIVGKRRSDIYLTQVLIVLPKTPDQEIKRSHYDVSFDQVTRHEIDKRPVIALGEIARDMCARHGITSVAIPSPSKPGISHDEKAHFLAQALNQFSF